MAFILMKGVVERFDAEAVSGYEEFLVVCVPDGESEHAVEVVDAFLSVFEIGVEEGFGIGLGVELVSFLGERVADGLVVVDFAVEDDGVVGVGDWLCA